MRASIKCPRCEFEFILESNMGECPACENKYTYTYDEALNMKSVSWDFGDLVDKVPKKATDKELGSGIYGDSLEYCPTCGTELAEQVSESNRYYIIEKSCDTCSFRDEEVIKKT